MDVAVNLQEVTNSDLFSEGQIRLAEISVFNWGSFGGLHTVRIDPDGTLVTGDNGAGKSTLIDALFALLLPAGKAAFNVAAAQGEPDRSLMTYIRGNYGAAHDGSNGTYTLAKRPGATVTALRALYRCDDTSTIMLGALFWTTKAGNALADLKRQYFVARRDLSLEAILSHFSEGNIRQLRQHYDGDASVTLKEHFNDYEEIFLRALRIENRKAPALLARAMGLKKVDDLTQLIRHLVLEPSNVREMAQKLVAEFDNLIAIHNELEDARKQRDHLAPLSEHAITIKEQEGRAKELRQAMDAISPYFGEIGAQLYRQHLENLDLDLGRLQGDLNLARGQESLLRDNVTTLKAVYENAGGDQLDALRDKLQSSTDQAKVTFQQAQMYQVTARALKLDDTISITSLQAVQRAASQALAAMPQRLQEAEQAVQHAHHDLVDFGKRFEELREEISETERRPDSSIPISFQHLRNQINTELRLDKDELLFLGELVDVQDEDRSWQGAIERALGGLRTTLLINRARVREVTSWLNRHHTGLHVRLITVEAASDRVNFLSDGFLRKLQWRDHPYKGWLKVFLHRHDLHCVTSVEILNTTPYSLTIEGLLHRDKGRFEKNDRSHINNRREWALGFSSKYRLEALKEELAKLGNLLAKQQSVVQKANDGRRDLITEQDQYGLLINFAFEHIDIEGVKVRIAQLEKTIAALEHPDGDLHLAKQRLDQANGELEAVIAGRDELIKDVGSKENEIHSAESAKTRSLEKAGIGISASARETLCLRIKPLTLEDLYQLQDLEKTYYEAIDTDRGTAQSKINTAVSRAASIMGGFSTQWEAVAIEWGTDISAIDLYIEHQNRLEQEGLPDLTERFRETLNDNTTQGLANLNMAIRSEKEEIEERIEIVNSVLRRTEFREGTYLRIKCVKDDYPHVREFNRQAMSVLSQVASDDQEKRFRDLKVVIDKLAIASDPATSGNRDSQRLLDARYQLSFIAEDVDKNDRNRVLDVLGSTSGKSGGEKESFAGNIVAASLAYVLTPDGCSHPIYSTVFLDEAFSNTAEKVSRRVLKVFKELNLHLNLITPYKNLNIARETAGSLIIAERDAEQHESRLTEVTWEVIDKRIADGLIIVDE